MFAALPLALDGIWIHYYLRRFTSFGIRQGHHEDDTIFGGGGPCIRSYGASVTGLPVAEVDPENMPSEWFGNVEHTHKAIYDALGYSNRHRCIEQSRAPGAASLPVRADGDRPNRANTTHLSRTGRPFDRLVRQSTGRSPATRRGVAHPAEERR